MNEFLEQNRELDAAEIAEIQQLFSMNSHMMNEQIDRIINQSRMIAHRHTDDIER